MANAENRPVILVLVVGGSYQDRETWIANELARDKLSSQTMGIILEGLPTGMMHLQTNPHLIVERIAPGCFCCIGNLVLRVTLTRILRSKPSYLYLAMQNREHLTNLKDFLQQESFVGLLHLGQEITL